VQVISSCLLLGAMLQLLLGLNHIQEAASQLEKAFQDDYQMALCGRFAAMNMNLQSAVTTWRKRGCEGDEEQDLENDMQNYIEQWRVHGRLMNPESCLQEGPLGMSLHLENNPALDKDYPNWVVHYAEAGS